jgi:hypothetical protein
MSAPRNLDPAAAAEHRIRGVVSDLTRTINRCREQDPALTGAEVAEALERLLAKYTEA